VEIRTNIIQVIAAVIDQQQLTLYKKDGQTVIIPQGDPRLAIIIKTITPVLASGMGAVADVDLGVEAPENPYQDFETMFGKAIQFFRVDKSKLAEWIGKATQLVTEIVAEVIPPQAPAVVLPTALGQVPSKPDLTVVWPAPDQTSKTEKLLQVTEEIIAHAKPAYHPEFHNKGEEGSSTVVAVMGNKVIANVEKLKPQISHAVKNSSAVGFSAFMARIAAITDIRRHSVDDLLTFLEKGDLPIADDGSIIIYKVLLWEDRATGTYVDWHTRKVIQRIGSYVYMDPSLVDHNRKKECSNGLHVARRGYLKGFPGDVCILGKVAPEDVIAVPDYDANKMRVCGYHILFELPDAAFRKLKQNLPFTDTDEARLLLGRAIAGDHPAPSESVKITQNMGGGVITNKISVNKRNQIDTDYDETAAIQSSSKTMPAEALEELSNIVQTAPKVDPKRIATQVTKIKQATESRRQKALRLHAEYKEAKADDARAKALQTLIEFKKSTKLGWLALGISDTDLADLQDK
jgi:hypothetical protein